MSALLESWQVIQQSITITVFVAMIMLMIEYFNVATRGAWMNGLGDSRPKQYLVGILIGAIPGCLGGFAMVSLYAHRRVTIGALTAAMIASSGDEAFIMLALFPKTALLMFAGMMLLGFAAGWFIDSVVLRNHASNKLLHCDFHTHHDWEGGIAPLREVMSAWRSPSAVRAILTVVIALFIVLVSAFEVGLLHRHEEVDDHADHAGTVAHADEHESGVAESIHTGWETATLVALLVIGLFIIATVSDHFLDEHLWKHVLRGHVPKIFLWTLGALAAVTLLNHFVDMEHVIADNIWLVLAIACAIGFIPESGPHLIFVTLYASGSLPLSILIANSIIQDGHGMIPMLAHSRRDFFLVKALSTAIGLSVGVTMLLLGW